MNVPENPLNVYNRMYFGGQNRNPDIQPLAPNAAYGLPQDLNNAIQEQKGDALKPLAGRYMGLMYG